MESKKRRDESQPRNVPSPAEHMQEYHLDDVILRADILMYPRSLKTTLSISRTGRFPALHGFLAHDTYFVGIVTGLPGLP